MTIYLFYSVLHCPLHVRANNSDSLNKRTLIPVKRKTDVKYIFHCKFQSATMKTAAIGFFLLQIFCYVESKDSDYIKCPLVWANAIAGDELPSGSISSTTYGTINFICRAKLPSSGLYAVGRYSKKDQLAFIPSSGSVGKTEYFEVLTNPNNCNLEWKSGLADGSFVVPSDVGSIKYVGRSVISTDTIFSGEIAGTGITIVAEDGTSLRNPTSFEILRSYSNGLNLQMTDFIFDEDLIGSSTDILGIDEIHNLADTEVKQTVSHTKIMKEVSVVKTASGWSRTYKVGLSYEPTIGVPTGGGPNSTLGVKIGLSLDYAFNHGEDRSKEIMSEKETEISVKREVTLPPFSSVQVCSTIAMKENFETGFLSKGEYSAAGLSGSEVLAILKEDGKDGVINGNSVIVEERGSLGGTMSLTTQFIVVPFESQGCSQLHGKIRELRQSLQGKANQTDVAQKYRNVQSFVSKLARK